ncbi:MAG: uL22 family ribosomal protein [Candidatus Caenarcaniphilales bacterium]|nr:uL22 family ribosomal protein [Candidatus Caenarcaniphilales bacterium]
MGRKAETSFRSKSTANTMIKGSIAKLKRPLDVIRGTSLQEAMNYLYFCEYISSKNIAKLIKSAAANAINKQEDLSLGDLWITKIWAVQKLSLRRMKAAPRGRGRPISRSYSQVYVELGVKVS